MDDALRIVVQDEPGAGGACHYYETRPVENPTIADPVKGSSLMRAYCAIRFQEGPVREHGINGISMEALLAIVQDRLEGFQSGEYANEHNQQALDYVRSALLALHTRTRERVARGVEGTNTT